MSFKMRKPMGSSDAAAALKNSLNSISGGFSRGFESIKKGTARIVADTKQTNYTKATRELDGHGFDKYNISGEDKDKIEIYVAMENPSILFNEGQPVVSNCTDGRTVGTLDAKPAVEIPKVKTTEPINDDFLKALRGSPQKTSYTGVRQGCAPQNVPDTTARVEQINVAVNPHVEYQPEETVISVPIVEEVPVAGPLSAKVDVPVVDAGIAPVETVVTEKHNVQSTVEIPIEDTPVVNVAPVEPSTEVEIKTSEEMPIEAPVVNETPVETLTAEQPIVENTSVETLTAEQPVVVEPIVEEKIVVTPTAPKLVAIEDSLKAENNIPSEKVQTTEVIAQPLITEAAATSAIVDSSVTDHTENGVPRETRPVEMPEIPVKPVVEPVVESPKETPVKTEVKVESKDGFAKVNKEGSGGADYVDPPKRVRKARTFSFKDGSLVTNSGSVEGTRGPLD